MKIFALLLVVLLLAGCATGMTPEQLKASAGMTTCSTSTNIYGSVSFVTSAADAVRKGDTASGDTDITCGSAKLVIKNNVGVAAPVVSTTTGTSTTTTVVKPQ